MTIDDKEIIVASAKPMFNGNSFKGFRVTLSATDWACHSLGYYAEIVPNRPFPGSGMSGYLKHYDHELDDVFYVRGTYAANADGASRLDVTIESVVEQLVREREQSQAGGGSV